MNDDDDDDDDDDETTIHILVLTTRFGNAYIYIYILYYSVEVKWRKNSFQTKRDGSAWRISWLGLTMTQNT